MNRISPKLGGRMKPRAPHRDAAGGIAADRPLRIGLTEAHPWCYRADRTLLGLDVAALEFVAATLGRSPEYHSRQSPDLAHGLLAGEYDIAIGGLLPDGHRDIQAIPVPHARVWSGTDARLHVRRVFFPNVWWIRRADLALRIRLRVVLFRWRLSMRHASADMPHAR
jgi:ABC-type amino acid transport substrate-binding protein